MTEEKSVRQSGKGLWNKGSLPSLCMFWNVVVGTGHSWLGQGVLSMSKSEREAGIHAGSMQKKGGVG